MGVPVNREEILTESDFGRAKAENDKLLAETFVETDLWRFMLAERVDVVLGAKGSGKSAVYAGLFRMSDRLRRQKIHLVGAENLTDDPVLRELPRIPAATWDELVGVWKLYILTLVGEQLRKLKLRNSHATFVVSKLQQANLLPEHPGSPIVELFARVVKYTKLKLGVEFSVDPMGMPTAGVTFEIGMKEPSPAEKSRGAVSVHQLLLEVGQAVGRKNIKLWVLIDRLDTAFPSASSSMESAALSALIQTYIDLVGRPYGLSLKLFLRDDVWERIARHPEYPTPGADVVEPFGIRWDDDALIDLVSRRLAHNRGISKAYGVNEAKLRQSLDARRDLVSRVVFGVPFSSATQAHLPERLLNQFRDGEGRIAPRELIRLLTVASQVQLERIHLGIANFKAEELFEPETLADAARQVSQARLFQTLCLEYPELYLPISQLRGGRPDQTPTSLAGVWRVSEEQAAKTADELRWLGFFERGEGSYRVANLYQAALGMV